MTLNGNIQTVADLKQRELELKARGFDIMREAEAVQKRLNQLNGEKNAILQEVQKIYTFVENTKIQIQEAAKPIEGISELEEIESEEIESELEKSNQPTEPDNISPESPESTESTKPDNISPEVDENSKMKDKIQSTEKGNQKIINNEENADIKTVLDGVKNPSTISGAQANRIKRQTRSKTGQHSIKKNK